MRWLLFLFWASAAFAQEPAEFSGMLAAHNAARRAVGVPDLSWSVRLAGVAQGWAERLRAEGCAMRHSDFDDLGENLAWASGMRMTPGQVVGMWVAEGRDFDARRNACREGAECGHYTQVVWRDTTQVGCGVARCGREEVWVCEYAPQGNWEGERPY